MSYDINKEKLGKLLFKIGIHHFVRYGMTIEDGLIINIIYLKKCFSNYTDIVYDREFFQNYYFERNGFEIVKFFDNHTLTEDKKIREVDYMIYFKEKLI